MKRVDEEPPLESELGESGDPAPTPRRPSRAAANSGQGGQYAVNPERKRSSESDTDEDDGGDGKQNDFDDWLRNSKE